MNKALVEKTARILDSISKMDFIKPYVLVGGTALSLQLEHRLSEDLDFMRWQENKGENMDIEISLVRRELEQILKINSTNIFEFNHVEFHIENSVKLSFYAPEKRKPLLKIVPFQNNLVLADIDTIASLKMETMLRRSAFRDYYDMYCIFNQKSKDEIKAIIDNALKYSGHNLKSKNLLGMLVNSDRFKPESGFQQLSPRYHVTPNEIESFMVDKLKNIYSS